MKKIIVLLFVIVFATSLTAQDRVNRERKSFEKYSSFITSATGWAYSETRGEWIDYKNIICTDYSFKDKYPSLKGSMYHHSISNSFNNIIVRTITFDKLYYVIIFDETHGAYRYPYIKEDWYEYKTLHAYILDESNFNKLMNPGNDIIEIKGIRAGNRYGLYNIKDLEIEINSIMTSNRKGVDKIAVYMTSDNQNIRFLKDYSSSNVYEKMTTQYFELPVDEWHKLQNFE